MASKKISELTAGSALDGTETIPLVQGGGTVRALISAIKTYINGVASTWSAAQTFSSTVEIEAAAPRLILDESDASSNERIYDFAQSAGQFLARTRTDADAAGATWLTVDRTGTTVDSIAFAGTALTINGNSAVTISEGSFTITLTGMAGATTGTVSYRVFANAAGTGKQVTLYTAASITGTSNTTALTGTGLPAAVTPSVNRQSQIIVAIDNDLAVQAMAAIGTNGTITFYTDDPLSATGWTGSGGKGMAVCTITYPL